MNIIILGYNAVSVALATALTHEAHNVTMISQEKRKLEHLARHLDMRIIIGKPTFPKNLHQANAGESDIILAMTEHDETNMVACQIAYSLFKIPKKIARIESTAYFAKDQLFGNANLPIDTFINPNQLIAHHIANSINERYFCHSCNIADTVCHMQMTKIGTKNPYLGELYSAWASQFEIYVPAVRRKNKLHMPTDSLICTTGDELCLIGTQHNLRAAITELHHTYPILSNKNLMINGGNAITEHLINQLSSHHHVKVIEPDTEVCRHLTTLNNKTMILNGSASDNRLLTEEHISDTEIFCAVTSDDEDNILTAIQAKYLGAKQAMAIIHQENYLAMLQNSQLNQIISPQHLITRQVLTLTREKLLQKTLNLPWPNAELICLPGSFLQRKIPKHHMWQICGIIHQQQWRANQAIQSHDEHAICFVPDSNAMKQLRAYLSKT